ncbi:class I SAM-dependent methyltransferase [Methanocella sp. MCL-LM]|uniref:class I SAM-dependent methyltransferase n=1 Tax=Methanocella sp. MCL-LM TaxID=3412035 RepID=UPI003C7525B2
MKQSDRDILSNYYGSKLEQFGHDTRSLGWIPGGRKARFTALSEIGDLDGCSILDVGCGFGDLYGFLVNKGLKIDYTGIDIHPQFVEIARKAYPEARFFAGDFDDGLLQEEYDWAFAAGIFTIKISDNEAFAKGMLQKMLKVSRRGVAADFLLPTYSEQDAYWRPVPEDMLKFCRTLSRRVALRCDYMSDEYCVYLYKNDQADERNVFETL